MSQQDFAAHLGISPASLSSIFTGRTNPTSNHVMAIHRAFPQINVNWLMFGEGEMLISSAASTDGQNEAADSQEASAVSAETSAAEVTAGVSSAAGLPLSAGETLFSNTQTGQNGAQTQTETRQNAYAGRREASSSPRGGGNFSNMAINIDKDQRKIKEIRVFFSDGTYESFVPTNK